MRKYLSINQIMVSLVLWFSTLAVQAQISINGEVQMGDEKIEGAIVQLIELNLNTITDSLGKFSFKNIADGRYHIVAQQVGYKQINKVRTKGHIKEYILIELESEYSETDEVVVTGNMKETSLANSVTPVEVIHSSYLKKAPNASLFGALSMVNGVRPQLNCSVCSAGDIHINGMEGAYTMVLIDGMPIVSSLSSVYGLMGIPISLVERIEVIKGPASTLYGSEAVGGLINVITKKPEKAPKLYADYSTNSYEEHQFDLGFKYKKGKMQGLTGVNLFLFEKRFDINSDHFTDLPTQKRFSFFNKWSWQRKNERQAELAVRLVGEERFGGEMNWTKQLRGSDSIYGESIYTKRLELIGKYQLPINSQKIVASISYNVHDQNSAYGNTPFIALQHVYFGQLLWDKKLGERHDLLMGTALRYTWYDDNTFITRQSGADSTQNLPTTTWLPGIFVQDEIKWGKITLLGGLRHDYHSHHGSIVSPRLGLKWAASKYNIFRLSLGNGYRVVNLFSEDHATFSGSRKIVVEKNLRPEKSYNANLAFQKFFSFDKGMGNFEGSVFYTYFTNKIVADYFKNDNEIYFGNLSGYGVSKGLSGNLSIQYDWGLKAHLGATIMEVYQTRKDTLNRHNKIFQVQTPSFTGNFGVSYTIPSLGWLVDWTGNVYSPMKLPVLANDFRPEKSNWFSTHNIQASRVFAKKFTVYLGVKNLTNFIPTSPIMRPNDPFDKQVNDATSNPNAYSFDTAYNYAPLQKRHYFIGIRYLF